jgi:transposase
MLSHQSAAPQPRTGQLTHIGVGIDTSRYGHYAAFLGDDLQPAAGEVSFSESAAGYALLRQRLEQIGQRHGPVHFTIRLDAAGQYADNLLHWLHGLASAWQARPGDPGAPGPLPADFTISCGDPQRNKNYRAALFGDKKSDPIEARAAARYALGERPTPVKVMPASWRILRQVAGRLQAVVRQRTRLINQLHHLLALAFPELALVVKDIAAGWVLELLSRFPTAQHLAGANEQQLDDVPYLPQRHVASLLQQACTSVASLQGPIVEELVCDQVRQLRDSRARQKRLENLLVNAYRQLPQPNHLDTIPGIGPVTAAILTAFIVDIDRFKAPGKLVAYFGTLPIEAASGVDRDGRPRGPRRFVMSRRGNDLVRRYLWMAALSAVRHNPAVRALYARVVAKHPDKKAIAIGHGMRKLLHLAFAVWKTSKPFDPEHYPWDAPVHVHSALSDQKSAASEPDLSLSQQDQAAAHTLVEPARPVVTAARKDMVADRTSNDDAFLDFAHLKRQLPISRVLDQLGLLSCLRGNGPQRRGTCPIHRGDARGRTFSVHLDRGVFQCFDASCGRKGDVIDLWANVRGLPLRQAALDLVHTFGLEPAPRARTEKRNG